MAIFGLLALSQTAHAFKGDLQFIKTQDGITHSAKLSNWHVDKKGVPSFDYTYKQTGPNCEYSSSGKAIAGFDEYDGKVELAVYNPEDGKGRELDSILLFYNDPVKITLPFKESRQATSMSFVSKLTKAELMHSCLKQQARLSVVFGKAVP